MLPVAGLDHNTLHTLQLEGIRQCYKYHYKKAVLDPDGNRIEIVA